MTRTVTALLFVALALRTVASAQTTNAAPGERKAGERYKKAEMTSLFKDCKEPEMSASTSKQPAIARIWRGRTTRERADEYEAYNYEAGIKPLIKKALGVQTFREDRENETEFMTISYWESVEAMSKFTGGDPTKIHHLGRDKEFLIELPTEVQILRLLTSHGVTCSTQ